MIRSRQVRKSLTWLIRIRRSDKWIDSQKLLHVNSVITVETPKSGLWLCSFCVPYTTDMFVSSVECGLATAICKMDLKKAFINYLSQFLELFVSSVGLTKFSHGITLADKLPEGLERVIFFHAYSGASWQLAHFGCFL